MATAANFNSATVKGLSTAYGFVLGQEDSLARIDNEYPDLSSNVALARAQFGGVFPYIQVKLEARLQDALGDKGFKVFAATMQANVREMLARQKITKATALDFLDQVKNRSKGAIESPVLEYLLAVTYQNNPLREFGDGFRQRFQTDGSGKSQGIKVNLQLPKSWTGKDGERPHIVQKWVSLNSDYFEIIQLIIMDAEGNNLSKEEMLKFVATAEVKTTIPDGASYVASDNFSLETQPGYWVEMTMSAERAGFTMYQESLMYQLFFRGKGISIFCSTGGQVDESLKVAEAFKRMRPLCQQVLNSLVLPQAY